MLRILEQKKSFYESVITGEKRYILEELQRDGISILPGFINNYNLVKDFYSRFYKESSQRIVLCGINPGRNGAGKTGIPFLDFKSVSEFLPIPKQNDSEISAQFVKGIVDYFGVEDFFNKVYLTNISWFGFIKANAKGTKNVNYYQLSDHLQEHFIEGFIEEMEIVHPTKIIPLSEEVEKSLNKLKQEGKLRFDIANRLWHPYFCSFKSNFEEGKKAYIYAIQQAV